MSCARSFRTSLYSLTTWSAIMLAVGEGSLFPAAFTVLVVLTSWYVNDHRHWWRLSTFWSNVYGVLAFGLAVVEFRSPGLDNRLLAGAHLLVYISWILLFQEKRLPQYWGLLALGMLQVGLGSVLAVGSSPFVSFVYAFLLLTYVLGAMWTLAVFTLFQGELRYRVGTGDESAQQTAPEDRPARGSSTAGEIPVDEEDDDLPALNAPQAVSPWNFAPRPAEVRNAFHVSSQQHPINLRFALSSLRMTMMGILIGGLIFVLVPRNWSRSANLGDVTGDEWGALQTFTGFTEEVRLGDIGQIMENSENVLSVRLFDYFSDEPIDIYRFALERGMPEPLFRGKVLDTYSNGRWVATRPERSPVWFQSHPKLPGMIRQEYALEPVGTKTLFAMRPIELGYLKEDRKGVMRIQPENGELEWAMRGAREPVIYRVLSSPVSPGSSQSSRSLAGELTPFTALNPVTQEKLLAVPEAGLERLIRLAQERTAAEYLVGSVRDEPSLRVARTLEHYLRDSGLYSYSLNASIQDPTIDPVEDFLFNRKTGHCEYYASTLTLMLRSVGIPARMISGFKGGLQNTFNQTFEVQQRHAHAWVEAWVDHAWVTFDATPAARDDAVKIGPLSAFWMSVKSLLWTLWTNQIMSMNYNKQKTAFFDPLQNGMFSAADSVSDSSETLKLSWESIKSYLKSPRRWFSWQGGAIAFLLLSTLLSSLWLIRRAIRWFRTWRIRQAEEREAASSVEWFEQFLTILRPLGLSLQKDQTPREFAQEVETAWSSQLAAAGLTGFPRQLAEDFYAVRFGHGAAKGVDLPALYQGLRQLETSVRAHLASTAAARSA